MSHPSHAREYFLVFLALCVCTALSVIADVLQLSDRNVTRVLVLAIAVAKALCVMLFFMHLKFERAWKYLVLAPTLILAASIPVALASDMWLHYYTVDTPQAKEHARQQQSPEAESHPPAQH
jgi:cytochrome c oxidase subunit 4